MLAFDNVIMNENIKMSNGMCEYKICMRLDDIHFFRLVYSLCDFFLFNVQGILATNCMCKTVYRVTGEWSDKRLKL